MAQDLLIINMSLEFNAPGNSKLPVGAECSLNPIILRGTIDMADKEMFSSSLPVIRDMAHNKSSVSGGSIRAQWSNALKNVRRALKGKNKERTSIPDPAAGLILQIEDREVAGIVRDLHYRTPKSLQAMRKACEQCFVLPDDCPYYDYSIFDVKKAKKRLADHPKHRQKQVVAELRKINRELAYHLSEDMD